ncbi:MAG: hypothetical protein RMI63_08970 [Caldimicrobium sp.]|nr:hypothetical protein [Caldimicrobium sp.]MDW8093954.1 hypothetical protein [Caldimicrobium sp.]MDW8095132.1 hypothetical protein [Caldimicrobium sp.]
MIKEGYSAEEVRAGVQKWFAFINPSGFSGDGCYKGRCEMPFAKNGCGGMDPQKIRY